MRLNSKPKIADLSGTLRAIRYFYVIAESPGDKGNWGRIVDEFDQVAGQGPEGGYTLSSLDVLHLICTLVPYLHEGIMFDAGATKAKET